LGTNDATCPGWRALQSYQHLTALLNRLKSDYSASKFVLTKPILTSLPTANAVINGVLATTIAQCVADDPVRVSMCDATALPAGTTPTQLLSLDGIHPTNYGYELLAQLWARAGAAALGVA
jgi:lysophospholipase L1-like esterase